MSEWICRRCGDKFEGKGTLCPNCKTDNDKIDKLIKEGHTSHCACRKVWGDGECECNKSGITREEQAKNIIELIRRES